MVGNEYPSVEIYKESLGEIVREDSKALPVGSVCAECVRQGAANVRVYRSRDGMNEHLRDHHKLAIA